MRTRRPAAAAAVLALAGAAVLALTGAAAAAPQHALSAAQVATARHALLGAVTAADARHAGGRREHGAWPAAVRLGSAALLTRGAAVAAMGEPGAVLRDADRIVLCVQARGAFDDAADPRPLGAPVRQFRWVVSCVDPRSGAVDDGGLADVPMRGSQHWQVLDVRTPVAAAHRAPQR